MQYGDYTCLSWKEILSQIDDYYQVNLLLVKNITLISENNILPKSSYYYLTRFKVYRDGASGRRGRKATNMEDDREKAIDYKGDQNIKSIHRVVCVLHLLIQPCHACSPMVHTCNEEQSKGKVQPILIHLACVNHVIDASGAQPRDPKQAFTCQVT
jgi:hypothetical protein